MEIQKPSTLIQVPILLIGSLIRHVMLVPEKQGGQYTAHVREASEPLTQAMIAASLEEHDDPNSDPRPSAVFVLNYRDLPSEARFGEQHSVLDYFPRGSTKKLQNEERLRVRSEQISNKTVSSSDTADSTSESTFDPIEWLLKKIELNGGASSGQGQNINPDNQIMVVYDHDTRFRKLVDEANKNQETRNRFQEVTASCRGGIVLAINDHGIMDDELGARRNYNDSNLKWFGDAVDLCLHENNKDRSVVVIAADALRKCGQRIMERGAVESSVNDIIRVIHSAPFVYDTLRKKCRNLVVVFRETGTLWIDLEEQSGRGVYGPNCDRYAQMHRATYGHMPGKFTTVIASVVRELCWTTIKNKETPDIDGALRMAIAAYNYHYDKGFMHGVNSRSPFNDFIGVLDLERRKELMQKFEKHAEESLLASIAFSWQKGKELKWSRVDTILSEGFDEKMIEVVQYGVEKPFRIVQKEEPTAPNFKPDASIAIPYSEYGRLKLVDPDEIGKYSNLAKLIDKYLSMTSWTTPLSIAVFGAPGTGKSFAVKQIIQRVSPDRKTEPLIFNLAQFSSIDHLTESFHKVQDQALASREVPLVVFDEFDADLSGQRLGWLKYFLAPMQDGVFRGKEADYRVGRAIFLFAGGTSETFDKFRNSLDKERSERPDDRANSEGSSGASKTESWERAKQAKLPDFVSRLRGHLDVAGINPTTEFGPKGEIDPMIKLRRAILLRSALEQHAGEIFRNTREGFRFANINEELITAFLCVRNYVHGSRSMEAIIQMSRFIDGYYVPASLPSEELLGTHVDSTSFLEKISGWHTGSRV